MTTTSPVRGTDLAVLRKRAGASRSQVPLGVALRIAHELCEVLEPFRGHGPLPASRVLIGLDGATTLTAPVKRLDPPEVAFDARSDVFAVAELLFELLSGVRPVPGLSGAMPAVSSAWPAAPAALEAVLARALEVIPEERFSSLTEFDASLAQTGVMAERAMVARWAESLSPGNAMSGDDHSPYEAEKVLDVEGRLEAPRRAVSASDFNAPDEGSPELSREVKARSSVALPMHTGRPRMILEQTKGAAKSGQGLELPPENDAVPSRAKPPGVLPTLGARPVQPTGGLPIKWLLISAAVVLFLSFAVWLVMRGPQVRAPLVVEATAPVTASPQPSAGPLSNGDIDPQTGLRHGLAPVKIGTADHLARDHSDLDPVRLLIDSQPGGAEVTVNGEVMGVTPWGGDGDPLRGALITVKRKGFKTWSVQLDAGIDYSATVKLRRLSSQ